MRRVAAGKVGNATRRPALSPQQPHPRSAQAGAPPLDICPPTTTSLIPARAATHAKQEKRERTVKDFRRQTLGVYSVSTGFLGPSHRRDATGDTTVIHDAPPPSRRRGAQVVGVCFTMTDKELAQLGLGLGTIYAIVLARSGPDRRRIARRLAGRQGLSAAPRLDRITGDELRIALEGSEALKVVRCQARSQRRLPARPRFG